MIQSPQVLRTAFTRFEAGVASMMKRNGIRTAPAIEITAENTFNSPAWFSQGDYGIYVSESLARQGNTPITMGAVAHETGHVLSKHTVGALFGGLTIVDTKNVAGLAPNLTNPFKASGISNKIGAVQNNWTEFRRLINYQKELVSRYKGQEHEADRIMTHLLGSHDDALAMRRTFNSDEYLREALGTSGLKRMFAPVLLRNARNGRDKLYGTLEEIEANIKGVDLNDRSHVNRLIARRNIETMHERS